jgi:hypothetical protein
MNAVLRMYNVLRLRPAGRGISWSETVLERTVGSEVDPSPVLHFRMRDAD